MVGSTTDAGASLQFDERLLGLEYALEESVPTLVGALVLHLARKGVLDLGEFEADLRRDFNPDARAEDSTGALLATLASLVACYRRDADDAATARYAPVYETVKQN